MRRALSTLVLAATTWSYGAAIQCEMGSMAPEATRPSAEAPSDPHAHHGGAPADHEAPGREHSSGEGGHDARGHDHGGDEGNDRCLMAMACGMASTVALTPSGALHVPARSRATLPTSSPTPGVAVPPLDPPPPRPSA